MDCESARKWLDELIDGALKESEAEELRRHLLSCEECRRIYEADRRVWAFLDSHPTIEPSPDFVQKVMARVRKEVVTVRKVLHRALAATSAVAAVLIIALLLFVPAEVGPDLSPAEVAEIVSNEELLSNLSLAEEWEVAALMDILESVDELELESE